MIFIRLIGALLLALSGAAMSRAVNARETAALSQTEGFIAFIRGARVQIDCFAMPITQILAMCDRSVYKACGYTGAVPSGLAEFARECRVCDKAAHEIFSGFASEFGRGYREEQLKACDYYSSLLEERRRMLSTVLPQKKKRNSTLLLSGALAAAILLI